MQEFHKCTDRRETEIIEELSLESEEKTQHLRDGEDDLTVSDIQEKFLPTFGMTGGTESACLAYPSLSLCQKASPHNSPLIQSTVLSTIKFDQIVSARKCPVSFPSI